MTNKICCEKCKNEEFGHIDCPCHKPPMTWEVQELEKIDWREIDGAILRKKEKHWKEVFTKIGEAKLKAERTSVINEILGMIPEYIMATKTGECLPLDRLKSEIKKLLL